MPATGVTRATTPPRPSQAEDNPNHPPHVDKPPCPGGKKKKTSPVAVEQLEDGGLLQNHVCTSSA